MNKFIENSLFKKNPARFQELRKYVKEFNASYNGSNIIQDDIFTVTRVLCNKEWQAFGIASTPN